MTKLNTSKNLKNAMKYISIILNSKFSCLKLCINEFYSKIKNLTLFFYFYIKTMHNNLKLYPTNR